MAKPKPYYIDTPGYLYKYDTLDKSMFAFVLGVQFVIPSIRIKEAVEGFIELFNLNEDNYPLKQAITTYYRMLKDYRKLRKHNMESNGT